MKMIGGDQWLWQVYILSFYCTDPALCYSSILFTYTVPGIVWSLRESKAQVYSPPALAAGMTPACWPCWKTLRALLIFYTVLSSRTMADARLWAAYCHGSLSLLRLVAIQHVPYWHAQLPIFITCRSCAYYTFPSTMFQDFLVYHYDDLQSATRGFLYTV
jgi:hypothetical protein